MVDKEAMVFAVQRLRAADGTSLSFTVLGEDGLPVEAVEVFLAHLESKGSSPHTVEAYAYDLKDFFTWLDQEELRFEDVGLEQLSYFFSWLRRPERLRARGVFMLPGIEPAVANTTLVRKRAALASFYRFHSRRDPNVPALLGELVEARPTGRFVPMLAHTRRGRPRSEAYSPIRIHAHRRAPKTLTDDEIAALIAACTKLRDRFLVRLLDASGLRISEALGLRHADLRLRSGEIRVTAREDNANGARVKGMKDRLVPVGSGLLDSYGDYMESEYKALDSDFVFVNLFREPLGVPMTRANVKDLCARLRRRTGIGHFHSHALRHSYATRLLRAKVPVEVVAELLGHASTQTTSSTYSHLSVEDHRRILVEAGVIDREELAL
jgi:site-specific recombinase XerD